MRLELQSDNGDAQLVADGERFMLYDAATKTAYTGRLPAKAPKAEQARAKPIAERDPARPGAARRGVDALRRAADDRPPASRPTRCGSRPKDDGGLLGAAEVAWDAVRGVPLRAAIYAQGNDEPVLEVEATDVSYGKIAADEDLDRRRPRARR